jgi:hypothetical protein
MRKQRRRREPASGLKGYTEGMRSIIHRSGDARFWLNGTKVTSLGQFEGLFREHQAQDGATLWDPHVDEIVLAPWRALARVSQAPLQHGRFLPQARLRVTAYRRRTGFGTGGNMSRCRRRVPYPFATEQASRVTGRKLSGRCGKKPVRSVFLSGLPYSCSYRWANDFLAAATPAAMSRNCDPRKSHLHLSDRR